jgi:hypothetical protein
MILKSFIALGLVMEMLMLLADIRVLLERDVPPVDRNRSPTTATGFA